MTQKIMLRHLQSFFSQVLTASHGEEGLHLYRENPDVDIVISDISMPVMDGLEMIRFIKAIKKEQRIILISAHGDADNLLEAIELEVNHYLIKPVYRKKLIQTLYRMVRIINQEKKIREAEEALKESEKRYRTLVDNLPLGVYRKEAGLDGPFVMVNPALVQMLGFREEKDLLGLSFRDILNEEEDLFCQEVFLQKEVCLVKKGGEPLWALISSRPVSHDTSHPAFYDGTIQDITHRKKAENRLASYMVEIEMKNMALEEANGKIQEDLEKARLIHQQLLPSSFPSVPGISFAAHYQPAENIGGDFYNMHLLGDNLLIYLTDVTGHGLDGAILSVFVRETVNSYMNLQRKEEPISPSSLLKYIATRYCLEKFPHDYFICMLIGLYQEKTGLFSFVNAGMQMGPFLTTTGGLTCIPCSGPPISSVFGVDLLELTPHSVILEEGSTILITTDGLIEEKKGGVMYGEKRLKRVFYENRGGAPAEIISSIKANFTAFCGDHPGRDDITFLVMKRNGPC